MASGHDNSTPTHKKTSSSCSAPSTQSATFTRQWSEKSIFFSVGCAWHWAPRLSLKEMSLVQWGFLYKLRCLFRGVLCFDVLECESASWSLSKLDCCQSEWHNGSLSWPTAQVLHGYYLSLCILKCLFGRHNALHLMLPKKENEVWMLSAGREHVLLSFPLADLPPCHLVGLMSEPSGLAVESCSSSQVPHVSALPSPDRLVWNVEVLLQFQCLCFLSGINSACVHDNKP